MFNVENHSSFQEARLPISHLSDVEMEKLRRVIKTNIGGEPILKLSDLERTLRLAGQNMTTKDVQTIGKNLQTTYQNDEYFLDEIERFLVPYWEDLTDEEIRILLMESFEAFDSDQRGSIDRHDLIEMLTTLGEMPLNFKDLKMIFSMVNNPKSSSTFNYHEFIHNLCDINQTNDGKKQKIKRNRLEKNKKIKTTQKKQRKSSTDKSPVNEPIKQVTTENDLTAYIDSNKLLVLDFYAQNCESCQVINTVINQWNITEPFKDHVQFIKIDVDLAAKTLIEHYNIKSLPLFILIKNRITIERMENPLEQQLRSIIIKHAELVDKNLHSLSSETVPKTTDAIVVHHPSPTKKKVKQKTNRSNGQNRTHSSKRASRVKVKKSEISSRNQSASNDSLSSHSNISLDPAEPNHSIAHDLFNLAVRRTREERRLAKIKQLNNKIERQTSSVKSSTTTLADVDRLFEEKRIRTSTIEQDLIALYQNSTGRIRSMLNLSQIQDFLSMTRNRMRTQF